MRITNSITAIDTYDMIEKSLAYSLIQLIAFIYGWFLVCSEFNFLNIKPSEETLVTSAAILLVCWPYYFWYTYKNSKKLTSSHSKDQQMLVSLFSLYRLAVCIAYYLALRGFELSVDVDINLLNIKKFELLLICVLMSILFIIARAKFIIRNKNNNNIYPDIHSFVIIIIISLLALFLGYLAFRKAEDIYVLSIGIKDILRLLGESYSVNFFIIFLLLYYFNSYILYKQECQKNVGIELHRIKIAVPLFLSLGFPAFSAYLYFSLNNDLTTNNLTYYILSLTIYIACMLLFLTTSSNFIEKTRPLYAKIFLIIGGFFFAFITSFLIYLTEDGGEIPLTVWIWLYFINLSIFAMAFKYFSSINSYIKFDSANQKDYFNTICRQNAIFIISTPFLFYYYICFDYFYTFQAIFLVIAAAIMAILIRHMINKKISDKSVMTIRIIEALICGLLVLSNIIFFVSKYKESSKVIINKETINIKEFLTIIIVFSLLSLWVSWKNLISVTHSAYEQYLDKLNKESSTSDIESKIKIFVLEITAKIPLNRAIKYYKQSYKEFASEYKIYFWCMLFFPMLTVVFFAFFSSIVYSLSIIPFSSMLAYWIIFMIFMAIYQILVQKPLLRMLYKIQ